MKNLIEMVGITKAFGSQKAVDNVSLELLPGTVHALMGENGAGKSTLMKILAGVHQPDSGEIYKNGHQLHFAGPRQALDFGISTVFQELSLLPNLTIAENMYLGREPLKAWGVIDYATMRSGTRKALAELGLDLDPDTLVSTLTISQRQFVEIAHGIKAHASIFILDEPTAALNAADVDVLNIQIRRLKAEGKAVIYISHRMEEVFNICDTVTVMKDGRHVATCSLDGMSSDALIQLMVSRELHALFPSRAGSAGAVRLEFKQFKLNERSVPLSLYVCAGEIVALAGLEGQGQREIVRSIIGQHQPFGGMITVNGQSIGLPVSAGSGVRDLKSLGVGFVPEDRKEEGLLLGLPISANVGLGLHSMQHAMALAENLGTLVGKTMNQLNVKAIGIASRVNSLSGGNQQKVLLGRYLATEADILIVEEPTRGVDVGAKSEIYRLLRKLADQGRAILVLSRETLELIGLSDRIYVVHDETIVAEMTAAEASEHKILQAALSNREAKAS
jgi:ribose transport system ATP-binding protein